MQPVIIHYNVPIVIGINTEGLTIHKRIKSNFDPRQLLRTSRSVLFRFIIEQRSFC